jgi:peptidoglycan/LPS O-acetylase OafA/YrhL
VPGLDGLRVAAVVAYHLGAGWLPGGYLGVDVFFVLSGFLITGLLLARAGDGGAGLGAFWARRARRLLPALLVLLAVLALAQAAGLLSSTASVLRADALATLAYVANWHQLLAGRSYFARLAAPSPLQHTWSLGIEEQFYVLWPLLLLVLLRIRARGAAVGTTMAAAALSAGWAVWLALHGARLDRLYYGTDTRAFELLAGAALAMVVSCRPEPGPRGRRLLHGAGLAGAGVVVGLFATATATATTAVVEGGLLATTVAVLAVVADARLGRPGPIGAVLASAPLRFLGRISYAVYLWHWPVVVELTPHRTGTAGAGLQAARLAVTAALALASTFLVEEPLRRRRLAGWPRLARLGLAPLAVAGVGTLVIATTLPPAAAAAGPAPASGPAVAGAGGLGGEPRLAASLAGTAADPLRVTLVGDSVMLDEGQALTAALGATGAAVVTDMAYPGWGLSTDHGWQQGIPATVATTRPDVVLAGWSWDDDWLLADPAGYRAALDRFVQLLLTPSGAASGARAVVFVQFPPLSPSAPGQPDRDRGVHAWNALAASLPARFSGRVLYFPVAGAVERGGRFSTWLPPPGSRAPAPPAGAWVRVRAVDGTHLCPEGAARYASAVVSDLRAELTLPAPAGAWWQGAWNRDPAFGEANGLCPADHPPG